MQNRVECLRETSPFQTDSITMSKGYAIYLGKDNRKLKVVEFAIQQYPQSQQLMRFMNEHQNGTITCADLKTAGFEDITRDLMYPISPMGQSGCGKLADDAQIKLNDNGIQNILRRIVAYNNNKASEKIDKNRLVRIEYNEQRYKHSVDWIEKCIQHFYQLTDDLRTAFANVPGVSFEFGEEEAQYANLYFRVLYKGRYFIQLLGKFGGTTFIHIISSKQRFPQWEITIHPFEETCQLHSTFKSVHIDKACNEDVLQKVTASYNGRYDQYFEVMKLFKDIFNAELNESDFEYDLVRDCIMLHEETERSVIGNLLPKPIGSDVTEFCKYTTLETFTKILQYGTIRMNSVVAMNDTSETNILQDVIRNFKEPIETEADAYLESNTRFITSFSALKDNLPMWTQYGNKGTGVCMVFERSPLFKEDDLLHITYISKDDNTVKNMEKLQTALKDRGINFYFSLLDKYRNFIKYDFYKSEDEYRYLVVQDKGEEWTINTDYNLVAPYIDRRLSIGNADKKNVQRYNFPFLLRKAILGPAMPNKKYNVWQLNYIASRKNIWNFNVVSSKIDNFR